VYSTAFCILFSTSTLALKRSLLVCSTRVLMRSAVRVSVSGVYPAGRPEIEA
jgi:hypothetical protein